MNDYLIKNIYLPKIEKYIIASKIENYILFAIVPATIPSICLKILDFCFRFCTKDKKEMTTKHPKLLIIDYYDSLIQQVDIYTEEQLAKYTDGQPVVNKLIYKVIITESKNSDREEEIHYCLDLESPSQNFNKIVDSDPFWEHSKYNYSKVNAKQDETEPLSIDVLNKMRDELIDELKKGQHEALKYYETIKNELKIDKMASDEEIDRNVMARLFEKQFMFLYLDNKKYNYRNWNSPFKLYLVVLDFYLNKHERQLLK